MKELHQIVSLLRDIRLTLIEGSGNSGSSGGSGGSTPSGITSELVSTLPNPSEAKQNVIYVVPTSTIGNSDSYEEYILVNGNWEKLGSNPLTIEKEDVLSLFNN